MLGRRTLLLCLISCLSLASIAQKKDKEAIKKEDLPDFRRKNESFSKMSDKAIRADMGTFSIGGIEESIGKKPLLKISPSAYQNNYMRFKGKGFKGEDVEVTVTLEPFTETGKKFQKIEDYILKINGKAYYGNYLYMPETAIKSVTVLMGKDTIAIPPQAYADLFNLNFTYHDKAGLERTANGVFFSSDGTKMYIYLLSRDNTGSYEVTWVIQNRQYLRRVLDYGITP